MKAVCFKTLGCKVNQYETQAIREQLRCLGFTETRGIADIYIINTCTVTENSDRRSKELIRKALRESPNTFVLVTGCYAEKDKYELLKIDGIGSVVSNADKPKIPSILCGEDIASKDIFTFSISDFEGHTKAFVKVQDGCDRFCSFCKIPLVRGRSRSRSVLDIVDEVKRLVERGFKEVMLTGICLGDYGSDF